VVLCYNSVFSSNSGFNKYLDIYGQKQDNEWINIRSGYVSDHRNPVPQCYRSEHSIRMRQLFLGGYFFRSDMAAEHVEVTFGLKVEDAFHSFEGVYKRK